MNFDLFIRLTFNANYVCKWICNLPTTILISYGVFGIMIKKIWIGSCFSFLLLSQLYHVLHKPNIIMCTSKHVYDGNIHLFTLLDTLTFNANYVCKWICNLPTTILISYGEFRQFCRVFKHVSGREWSSNVQSRRPQCRSYTSNSKPLELQKWRSWGNTFSISTVLSIRESENKIK
jgi:uncharacterized membrane protein YczE